MSGEDRSSDTCAGIPGSSQAPVPQRTLPALVAHHTLPVPVPQRTLPAPFPCVCALQEVCVSPPLCMSALPVSKLKEVGVCCLSWAARCARPRVHSCRSSCQLFIHSSGWQCNMRNAVVADLPESVIRVSDQWFSSQRPF